MAGMDVVVARCAGLDVGKDLIVAAIRVPAGVGRRAEVRSFGATDAALEGLAQWLAQEGVTEVAMEATGDYWKPIWYKLEGQLDLLLVNARTVKKVPGRKSDVQDAEWLAQLLECGLLSGSFVPPPVIRELRDLTRYRTRLVQDRSREVQRVQKVLTDAGIKLASVASDVMGVSGRRMLHALVAGERDPDVLAELAKGVLRKKIPGLQEALAGRFGNHHALLLSTLLGHIDYLDTAIAGLGQRIDEVMAPFVADRDRLDTITGVGKRVAEIIIAEIGVDMARFPDAHHLASWAGMCPGNNESAGKHMTGRTRRADPWLRAALTEAAWAAARSKDTYLHALFWRVARRRGPKRAAIAVGHAILVAAWHILTDGTDYHDLGGDYFSRRHRHDQAQHHIRRLLDLGYRVTAEPAA